MNKVASVSGFCFLVLLLLRGFVWAGKHVMYYYLDGDPLMYLNVAVMLAAAVFLSALLVILVRYFFSSFSRRVFTPNHFKKVSNAF